MPNKKSIAFLGSKPVGYCCFRYLIENAASLNVEIVGVLTQARKEFGSGNDLVTLAQEAAIQIVEDVAQMPDCDILYSVQYHQILKAETIAKARQIAVNLHMAPLPEYRGCNQFSFAIIEAKKEFGTTVHVMDTSIDGGDILFQKRFPIPKDCWVNDLYKITEQASVDLFKETIGNIISGDYSRTPQRMMVPQYGTSIHYRNEMAGLKTIDLSWDAEKISRYVRGTYMPGFEPPFAIINGQKIFFTKEA